ncbi:glycosyltransferase [Polynucleobacter sp. CS-Odin-A6]|uniref:glycosyltransferase n=1 Tax=Polynucleobacter sp. CS-Odin-A6 TaxID=2689106 RepID=UPI001C0B7562|nr:glycosyltransferase [Polynucleobacter sp. CS-Odin-A6]MBU3621114.1 glycosyltransferase [Polynucleobacter sp. CS-Odin-A6]
MKIGIDFYSFNPEYSGGVHNFSIGLVDGFEKNNLIELVIITSSKNRASLEKLFYGRQVNFITIQKKILDNHINRIIWVASWITRNINIRKLFDHYYRRKISEIIEREIDVLIVPTPTLNFYALKKHTILCIHDIQHMYYPKNFSIPQLIGRWASYRLSLEAADAIQVSSQYVKNTLSEKFNNKYTQKVFFASEGVDLERFSTSSLAIKPVKILKDLQEDEFFVYYPAQLWPHKNHSMLLDALLLIKKELGKEITCILTGQDYGYGKIILNKIHKLKLEKIYVLGRVPQEEVIWLYKNCTVVLALGLHESSSLPVREGAQFGKVIVCADIPPNEEIKNQLNIELVNSKHAKELKEKLVKIHEERAGFIKRGSENSQLVKKFAWQHVVVPYLAMAKNLVKK